MSERRAIYTTRRVQGECDEPFDAGARKAVVAWLARGRWPINTEVILCGILSDDPSRSWPAIRGLIDPEAVLPLFDALLECEIRYSGPEYYGLEGACLLVVGADIYCSTGTTHGKLCLLVVGEGWIRDPRLGA